MGKSKFKINNKAQFLKILKKGKWKTFVDSVIEEGNCVLNTKKISGYTLLSCATQYGDKEIVDYLMQNGANCNASNFDGSIPLHVAAKHNHKDLLELFAISSVCIDSRDNKGRTALHYVIDRFHKSTENPSFWLKSYCHEGIIEEENMEYATFLLLHGADIDDEDYSAPCYIEKENMELATLLLRHGADIDAKDNDGNVPILLAEKHACPGVVEMLIMRGANVNYCKDDKWTMLHRASSRGWLRVAKLLVERKVDIDAENVGGDTALLLALTRSHVEIAELLIESGADVNGRWSLMNITALHYASRTGWLNIVKLLVEYKADINVSTSSGATPVMLAVKYMHRAIFDFLVQHGAELVGTCQGNTILHFACCTGWSDVIQSFVDRGHDIDAETSAGETPLLIAARHSSKEIVDILIKSGANLHICKPNSILLLHYVCANDWVDVFQSLVDAGLDINATYPDGRKLLTDLAANCKGLKIFDYLFEAGADLDYSLDYKLFYLPNFVNDESTDVLTVLHYASYFGRLEMVLSLISKGADVNVSNSAGKTPLYIAVRKENTEIVKQLLDAGANANVITLKGKSPLYVAVWMDNLEIVMHLIDAGADVNAETDGQTPLFYAVDINCLEIAKYLLKAGADCNFDNGDGSAFEFYVKYKNDLKEFPIFIENGAYITNDIYDALLKNSHFKEEILKNVELCTQAVLNKFNNLDLPQIYHVPFAVKNLPPIKEMKIGGDKYVAQCIESSVIRNIETNGSCNITKIRPIVLSLLSVEAFSKYYIKPQNN